MLIPVNSRFIFGEISAEKIFSEKFYCIKRFVFEFQGGSLKLFLSYRAHFRCYQHFRRICHQDISSPTSLTNIDLPKGFHFSPFLASFREWAKSIYGKIIRTSFFKFFWMSFSVIRYGSWPGRLKFRQNFLMSFSGFAQRG